MDENGGAFGTEKYEGKRCEGKVGSTESNKKRGQEMR